jgi:hypothetical protein
MAANVARAAAAADQTEAGGLLVAHWAGSPALAHLTAALPGWILAAGLAWNPAGCQHNKVKRVQNTVGTLILQNAYFRKNFHGTIKVPTMHNWNFPVRNFAQGIKNLMSQGLKFLTEVEGSVADP